MTSELERDHLPRLDPLGQRRGEEKERGWPVMGNAEPKEMHSGRESGYKGHDARRPSATTPVIRAHLQICFSASRSGIRRWRFSSNWLLVHFLSPLFLTIVMASDLPYWLVQLKRLFRAEALELAHRRLWDLGAVGLQDSGRG
jgi:hypothetical protein